MSPVLQYTFEQEIYSTLAGLSLLAYDTLCTLTQEVDLVWHGTWGLGNYLYIYARYAPFASTGVALRTMLGVNTAAQCKMYFQVYTTIACLTFNVCEVVLLFRTYALYGGGRGIVIACLVIYGLTMGPATVIDMYQLTTLQLYDGGTPRQGCVGTVSPILGISYILLGICEITIVVLTGIKAVQHLRSLSRRDQRENWVMQLYGQGFAFSALALTVSVVQISSIFLMPAHSNWLSFAQQLLHGVICSRLLLLIFQQKRVATYLPSTQAALSAPVLTTQALSAFEDSEMDFAAQEYELTTYRTPSLQRA
ncbi:hypothetical protein BD626DRAFT_253502 [Schizophyllum amplum]|uniref:DUF6533 domain-containing protein n=1 Tax=Schizophyllum amplum TaxID=97359 RepID=A0A550CIB6_9AGAR|nr:hypothetical protein BD626DRAFT_253502 [Auriculariopsis ampla]